MTLSGSLQQAWSFAVLSVSMFLMGHWTRTRGPQGIVHGVVDWSRQSEDDRRAAGRFIGLVLYLMGLVLLGMVALASASDVHPAWAQWSGLGASVVMTTLVVLLILGLLPYQKRYRDPPQDLHER